MLRKIAREGGGSGQPASSSAPSSGGTHDPTSPPDHALASEVKQLRAQLQQRDNEIAILVNMVKQAGGGPAKPGPPSSALSASFAGSGPGVSALAPSPVAVSRHTVTTPDGSSVSMALPSGGVGSMLATNDVVDPAILADREKAMDVFMATYPKAQAINDNKQLLKEKYAQAKSLADQVNAARDGINRIKKAIEVRRMERAVQSVAELKEADSETVAATVAAMPPDDEELSLKGDMDVCKKTYHDSFQLLRDTKSEIERIQRVFEAGKLRLHSDFESWCVAGVLIAVVGWGGLKLCRVQVNKFVVEGPHVGHHDTCGSVFIHEFECFVKATHAAAGSPTRDCTPYDASSTFDCPRS
jgi:kinesin family member 6/9